MKRAITGLMGATIMALSSFAALADDTVVYDGYLEPDDSVVVTEDPVRVYGWSAERPLDCGEFHYWNGAECIDAREVAPDTGPKY